MATIATTTLDALEELLAQRILETTPRIAAQRSKVWQRYKAANSAATTTRRFRIVWGQGRMFDRGFFTGSKTETAALLRVRVDYIGDPQQLQPMVQDDWLQLRDRLAALAHDPANGLVYLRETRTPPARVADTDHARQRASATGQASSDAIQVDLTYDIRYTQAAA
jgi:hypothetical protein